MIRNVIVFVVLFALALPPQVGAAEPTVADRESSYPPEVANVTHEPWTPRAGDDVEVTMRLADGATVPPTVTLLFCRLEPEYVCGQPLFMEASDDGRTWRGTIEWDDRFMEPETRHVGYNVTLRYDGPAPRVYAPVGNYWVPPTYPDVDGGVYFFYSLEGEAREKAPTAPLPLGLLLLAGLAVAWRRRRG